MPRTVRAARLLLFGASGWGREKPRPAPPSDTIIDARIRKAKRICIEKFSDDPLSTQARETLIAKLFESTKRYSLIDAKCDSSDLKLKGSVIERDEHTYRSESEGVGFAGGAGARVTGGPAGAAAVSGSSHESLSSSEVKQGAVVTLRIVDSDGEILWALSQESTGGKTKGAIGDAVERAVRRLLRDIERAEKQQKDGGP